MTKVFISYSRKDGAFAHRLVTALQANGLDTWIDWEDIPPTADWMEQIQHGIEEADAFIFLLSPSSVASKVCQEEVEHAAKNNKRLLPVVVDDVNSSEVFTHLAKLNWIFFRPTDGFDAAIATLNTAIRTDLAWVETHRMLQVRALEWERHQNRNLLMRGKDLRKAEEALAVSSNKDPQPTDIQRKYLLESRRNNSRGSSLVALITMTVAVLLGIIAAVAFVFGSKAKSEENQAITDRETAIAAQATAEYSLIFTEVDLRHARVGQLNAQSELLKGDDPSTALLLALEAANLSKSAGEPVSHDTIQALRDALVASSRQQGPGYGIDPISLEKTETLTVSMQGHVLMANASMMTTEHFPLFLYDLSFPVTIQPILPSLDSDTIRSATLSRDGKWLVYHDYKDGSISLVNLSEERASSSNFDTIPTDSLSAAKNQDLSFNFSPDGNWLFISPPRSQAYLVALDANPFPEKLQIADISHKIISPDSRWMAIQSGLDQPAVYLFDLKSTNATIIKSRWTKMRLLAISPDSHWMVIQDSNQNNVSLIDLTAGDIPRDGIDLGKTAESGVAGNAANEIRKINADRKDLGISFNQADSFYLKEVGFSPDGRWLVMSACFGQPGWSFPAYEPEMAVFCRDSFKASFTLWNISQPNPADTRIKVAATGDVTFTFSPDNQWVAFSDSAGTINLWGLSESGKEARSFQLSDTGQRMPDLIFSPDKRWLATLDGTDKIALFNLTTAGDPDSILIIPAMQTEPIQAIAFNHTGSWLAAVTGSGNILLWERELEIFSSTTIPYILRGSGYNKIAFSEDGRWLVSSGPDINAALWHMGDFELLEELACQAAGTNFTPNDWEKYFPDETYRATCPSTP